MTELYTRPGHATGLRSQTERSRQGRTARHSKESRSPVVVRAGVVVPLPCRIGAGVGDYLLFCLLCLPAGAIGVTVRRVPGLIFQEAHRKSRLSYRQIRSLVAVTPIQPLMPYASARSGIPICRFKIPFMKILISGHNKATMQIESGDV